MSYCPENFGKPHFFDEIGLCQFCLFYDPSKDKQEVRDGVSAEVRQVQRPDSLD